MTPTVLHSTPTVTPFAFGVARATTRDLPVLLGLTLAVTIAFALVNLLVDISYAWFDPRIRLGKEAQG